MIRKLFHLIVRPFRGRDAVDREIALHLELQVEDLVRRGMSRESALAEAHRRFGDTGRYRDSLLRMESRGSRRRARREWWSELWTDVRYLIRGLRATPSFVGGVAVTLALGIGVNAAMIGLVDRLLFKSPAHVVDPNRVVRYTLRQTVEPFGTFTNTSVTWKEFELQRQQMRSL